MNNIKKNVNQKKNNIPQKKIVKKKKVIKKVVKKDNKPRKKLKIKYGRIFLLLIVLSLFLYLLINILNLPIKNIFISGNTIYSDQEIIEMAKLENYPPTLTNLCIQIESRLEKNQYIKKAKVTKKGLFKVYIDIEENYPLFYSI